MIKNVFQASSRRGRPRGEREQSPAVERVTLLALGGSTDRLLPIHSEAHEQGCSLRLQGTGGVGKKRASELGMPISPSVRPCVLSAHFISPTVAVGVGT